MDNSNAIIQHILIQSRTTILDLLERRGQDGTPFRKLIGPELVKLASHPDSLRMDLIHKENPEKKCIVLYAFGKITQPLSTGDQVRKLLYPVKETNPSDMTTEQKPEFDPKMTEVVVLYINRGGNEDVQNKAALAAWSNQNLKISFFAMERLTWNPLNHVLQPKFEIVPSEEHTTLLKELQCRSKTQLPIIKFHADPVARCLGLAPLDIVKITAYSPTAGEYVKYRVCAP